MESLQNYADFRQTGFCAFCGASTETRDHVPSKVFLDEPYPMNLPVVPACRQCNESFSLDEEYCACLIECAVSGSAKAEDVGREKIRRILNSKPALVAKLEHARVENEGGITIYPEMARVRNIILKLATGHAAYELNEPQLTPPTAIFFTPLMTMGERARELFETVEGPGCWPEVGSRAMQRLLIFDGSTSPPWVSVQEGRYRYLAVADGEILIRGVLRDYLAYEVRWGEE